MDFGALLARGFARFGVDGPLLRNNAGVVEARTANNDGFAPFNAQSLRFETELNFAGRPWAVRLSPRANPVLGERFREADVNGASLYGWDWEWNGSYWLSPQQSQRITFDNLSALTRIHFVGSHPQNFDYFFERLVYSVVVPTANNASNRWSLQFQRLPSSGSSTAIGSAITTDEIGGVDVYGNLIAELNIHVDMSALNPRIFRSVLTRVGSPGNLFGCAELFFRYARP